MESIGIKNRLGIASSSFAGTSLGYLPTIEETGDRKAAERRRSQTLLPSTKTRLWYKTRSGVRPIRSRFCIPDTFSYPLELVSVFGLKGY
jgi:hypothetical protein